MRFRLATALVGSGSGSLNVAG